MSTSCISVGRFDQNLAAQRIYPRSPTNSQLLQVQQALFVPYLVPGSQWLRVYDFLLHSIISHAARKNTETRPEDSKLWQFWSASTRGVCMHIGMCELEATLDLQRTPYA
jgi:hypothetical protein